MISSIIVDDEKKNRDSLRKLLQEYCPDVMVKAEAASVAEATACCLKEKPELVFLDVEMPNGTGFDLLRQLDSADFKVIFVTAHSHYAIKAIRFSALDYLLKPVDTDDLIDAVRKVKENRSRPHTNQYKTLLENLNTSGLNKLAIPIKDGFAFWHRRSFVCRRMVRIRICIRWIRNIQVRRISKNTSNCFLIIIFSDPIIPILLICVM
jgi:two-component system LytT family response regulator